MEIPLNLILINPAIDIILFILFFYLIFNKNYKKILEKKEIKKIIITDLKISAIFLILGYLNYQGTEIEIIGTSFSWLIYIIIVQFIIEMILFSSKIDRDFFN